MTETPGRATNILSPEMNASNGGCGACVPHHTGEALDLSMLDGKGLCPGQL